MFKNTILIFLFIFSILPNIFANDNLTNHLKVSKDSAEAGRPIKLSHPSILKSNEKYNVVFKASGFERKILTTLVQDGFLHVFVPFITKISDNKPEFSSKKVEIYIEEINSNKVKFEIEPPAELAWRRRVPRPFSLHIVGLKEQIDGIIQNVTNHNPNDTSRITFLQDMKIYLNGLSQEWENRTAITASLRGENFTISSERDFEMADRIHAAHIVGVLEYLGYLNISHKLSKIKPRMMENWYQKVSASSLEELGFLAYENSLNTVASSFEFEAIGQKSWALIGAAAAASGLFYGIKLGANAYMDYRTRKKELDTMKTNNELRLKYAECVRRGGGECVPPPSMRSSLKSIAAISCSMNSFINTATADGATFLNEINPNQPVACVDVFLVQEPHNGGGGIVQYDPTCSEASAGFHKIVINGPGLTQDESIQCGAPHTVNGNGLSGGNYNVNVTVFDINGNSSTVSVPFTVPQGTGDKKSFVTARKTSSDYFNEFVLRPFNDVVASISASLGASTTNPSQFQTVHFFSTSTSSAYILNYTFNFSDGVNISRCYGEYDRSFNNPGNYSATLTVQNNLGESSTSAPLAITVQGSGD